MATVPWWTTIYHWQNTLSTSVASVCSLKGLVKYMTLTLLQSEECMNSQQKKILLSPLLLKIPIISLARKFFYRLFRNTFSSMWYSKKPIKLYLFSFKRKYIVQSPSLPNVCICLCHQQHWWTIHLSKIKFSPDFLKISFLIIAHDTGWNLKQYEVKWLSWQHLPHRPKELPC